MRRNDPLGREYYEPLAFAEKVTDGAFYVAGGLSLAVLLLDRTQLPQLYDFVQACFVVLVVMCLLSGLAVRTYFSVRAHTNRVADFVSNAFAVPLIPNQSTGYYNTAGEDPYLRMGSALLENALFTKAIIKQMLIFERSRIGFYLIAWLWAAVYRATDLGLVAVVAQVLFSEQLVARWVRMEWLRARTEAIYDNTYRLFQSTDDIASAAFRARVVEGVLRYETSKAQAGISLSSRVFRSLNSRLSAQWRGTAYQLGIGAETADPPP